MSIESTIPDNSIHIDLHCGRGNACISRRGWTVEFGNPFDPPVVRFGSDTYSYVDGSLVPRRLLEDRSWGCASIQVGAYLQPAENRTGWAATLPLPFDQCALFSYGDYRIAFNMAASPTIVWNNREFRVFEELPTFPLSALGDDDRGQMIDGKGVLIAPRVQLRDYAGRPVGPLLNYFAAPQTLGRINEQFNSLSGKQVVEVISQLRDVGGHDGAQIEDVFDLMNAAMCDVSELGKWHLSPIELLTGIFAKENLDRAAANSNPVDWPHGRYVGLLKDSPQPEHSPRIGLNSASCQTFPLRGGLRSSGFHADCSVSAILVRAEPA